MIPEDGSIPVSIDFWRADALITVKYHGETEVFLEKKYESVTTPWNGRNSNCPNKVGMKDGKFCISNSTVSLATQAPYFFKNPRLECSSTQDGCHFIHLFTPEITNGGMKVTGQMHNWGPSAKLVLTADLYLRLGEQGCGISETIPILANRTISLTALKACQPFATIEWKDLITGDQGVLRFGDNQSQGGIVSRIGSVIDNNTILKAIYVYKKKEKKAFY